MVHLTGGRQRGPAQRLVSFLALLSLVALAAAACTSDVDSGPVAADQPGGVDPSGDTGGTGETGGADGCDPGVDRALAGWAAAGFSGTVAFVDPARPCVAGYGSADPATDRAMTPDTVFSIGSITKAVTAAAIGGLEHEGRLRYDDRAGDLVPGLTGPVADATVSQLLLHTSGLAGFVGPDQQALTRNDALDALSALERVADPGTEFGYTNAGYTTLALIVDELTGDFRSHLVDEILLDGDGAPLGGFWDGTPGADGPRAVGMLDDGTPGADGSFAGPHWALDGAGGVAMTAEELARWAEALFGGRIIAPEALDGLLALSFDNGDGTSEVPGWLRLDGSAFGEPVFGAAGGGGNIGHTMTVAWLPESGRVFAVASNTNEVGAEQLLADLLPDLAAGRTPPGPPVASDLDPAVVEAASGQWSLPDGARFDVRADGPGLRVRALDAGAVAAVLPVGDPEAAADHQRRVLEVMGGSTEEGRRERERFEEAFGPMARITPFGTAFVEGEHRTWIAVELDDGGTVELWVALAGNDSIAAIEITDEPPGIGYLPLDDGTFGPLAGPGDGSGPRLALDDMGLRITNGDGEVVATPVG